MFSGTGAETCDIPAAGTQYSGSVAKDCFNPTFPTNDCRQYVSGPVACFGDDFNLPENIAIANGPPSGPCTASDKEQSLPVGGDLGAVNKDGTASERTATDINSLYSYGNPTIINNQTVISQSTFLGFYYYDNNGALWFQKSANVGWNVSVSFSLTLGGFFSTDLGITPPSQNTPVYLGNDFSKYVIPHTYTRACFSQGNTFLSNSLG
jgi:hypothetical protein